MTAWAALYVHEREAEIRGEGDREFLGRVFDRLLTNFTWWVNRKDPDDRNVVIVETDVVPAGLEL